MRISIGLGLWFGDWGFGLLKTSVEKWEMSRDLLGYGAVEKLG